MSTTASSQAGLEYGYRFPNCTENDALADEIRFTAKKYAGVYDKDTPPTHDTLPDAFEPAFNTSVNDQTKVEVVVNGTSIDVENRQPTEFRTTERTATASPRPARTHHDGDDKPGTAATGRTSRPGSEHRQPPRGLRCPGRPRSLQAPASASTQDDL